MLSPPFVSKNDPDRDKHDWAQHQALRIAEAHIPPGTAAELDRAHELMQAVAKALREAHKDGQAFHGVRKSVTWFADRMEKKLRANDHKGHWSGCTRVYLFRRLRTEVRELSAASSNFRRLIRKKLMTDDELRDSAQALISEAADVANFAMMIADQARERIK